MQQELSAELARNLDVVRHNVVRLPDPFLAPVNPRFNRCKPHGANVVADMASVDADLVAALSPVKPWERHGRRHVIRAGRGRGMGARRGLARLAGLVGAVWGPSPSSPPVSG